MPIAAQRYKFLDEETSLSVMSFESAFDSSIFNSPENALKESNPELAEMISSAKEAYSNGEEKYKDVVSEASRAVKGLSGQVVDYTKIPQNTIDEMLGKMSGGNASVKKSLSGMLSSCSKKGMSKGVPGKAFEPTINCGSGKSKLGQSGTNSACNASSMNDLLSRLTGGAYQQGYKDLNDALKALMALAGTSYDFGMCGVFGALSKGLSSDIVSRAAGGLLGVLGASGNVNGFLDVAKSSFELNPLIENPGAIGSFLTNFKNPSNVADSLVRDTAERAFGGLELLSPDWSSNALSGDLSWGMIDNISPDLYSCMSAFSTDNEFNELSLDVPIEDDNTWMSASYIAGADEGIKSFENFI